MDEIGALWADLARQRIATTAAAALEKRLEVVAAYDSRGCPTCKDVEASAFLAKLERIADETAWREAVLASAPMRGCAI